MYREISSKIRRTAKSMSNYGRSNYFKPEKASSLEPKAPYNFDANFRKPSHFPPSDNIREDFLGRGETNTLIGW
jgi:hypothetical protein